MPKTRSSSSESIPVTNGHCKQLKESKTSVWMIESNILNSDASGDCNLDIVKLRHPRSGAGTMFLFSPDNSVVHEIFAFSEKRSWFIDDTVRENGKMHISTPVDPLFLILQYLVKSKEEGKVIPLDDLLIDNKFPETSRLSHTAGLRYMHLVADQKGPEDLNAWMYNEDKTLKWLNKKVEKVITVLKEKQINVRGSAVSKNYIKSSKEEPSEHDNELYVKYACGLVSEYLKEDLSKKLLSHWGVSETPKKKPLPKRKASQTEEQENKKIKIEEKGEEEEIVVKPEKPKVVSAKEKAMKKAASGSKAITSFFKKK